MNWEQFTHAVRAAGEHLQTTDVLVIGSQAIHGSYPEDSLPRETTLSVEIDIAALLDYEGSQSQGLSGALGEDSRFHQTFAIYIDGIDYRTARAPLGWQSRLVKVTTPAIQGITAHCLEPHDLCVAKLIAGRPKDMRFVGALIKAGLVDVKKISSLIHGVPGATGPEIAAVHGRLTALSPGHVAAPRPLGLPPLVAETSTPAADPGRER